jgi:glyoxylase-like metal-dependent hydrolase (beta-lactamase superfamily II)
MVTHAHPDHADGARDLAARLRAELLTPSDGQTIETDAGDLIALATPGHTPDHMSFLLGRERAVFCGDLMMGGMDTALVALPEGDLGDYLDSLNRIRRQRPDVIYPAHGPAITEPDAAIERYIQHRMERLAQVTNALRTGPHSPAALVEAIYGAQLDRRLRTYAESAVEAYLAYLEEAGEASVRNGEWNLT